MCACMHMVMRKYMPMNNQAQLVTSATIKGHPNPDLHLTLTPTLYPNQVPDTNPSTHENTKQWQIRCQNELKH